MAAQDVPQIRTGDQVRIRICDLRQWRDLDPRTRRIVCGRGRIDGTVAELDSTSLIIESELGESREVALTSVWQIQVQQGQKSNAGRGFLIGAGAGVVSGFILCVSAECDSPSSFGPGGTGLLLGLVAISGLAGGVAGLLVGSQIRTDRWLGVPLDQVGLGVIPQPDRGVALGVSFRF